MSVDSNFYVGPYIEIMNPTIETTHEESYPCCINEKCKSYKKEFKRIFCPDCGEEIDEATKIVKNNDRLDIYNYLEDTDLDDKFIEVGSDYNLRKTVSIIPNDSGNGGEWFCDDTLFHNISEIDSVDNYPEWCRLISSLKNDGYIVEKKFGAIHWFS